MGYIELKSLKKSYGQARIINGIDAEIEQGEFVAILGPSGCGKSTLLRMIAGLENITDGDLLMAGRRINDMALDKRGCAMVFQNYALYPHMSVRNNIGYGLKLAKLPKEEQNSRIEAVAEMLSLSPYLDRKPHELSGGQRQRVAIGRAVARQPKIFLFDEPLSSLDAKLRLETRVELRELHERIGATSIFVTHDQTEAMTLADKIIVMKDGRIEQIGSPLEIYRHPATTFVAGFIGSPPVNLLQASIAKGGTQCTIDGANETPLKISTSADLGDKKITLGIRPEDLLPVPENGDLTLKIKHVEDLGSHRIVHAICGAQSIVLNLPPETPCDRGGRLRVLVPENKLHVFDIKTGMRI